MVGSGSRKLFEEPDDIVTQEADASPKKRRQVGRQIGPVLRRRPLVRRHPLFYSLKRRCCRTCRAAFPKAGYARFFSLPRNTDVGSSPK